MLFRSAAGSIGYLAGNSGQSFQAVAVGTNAGQTNQSGIAVAVGSSAGANTQGQSAVAIGDNAAANTQGEYGVAVGSYAGNDSQGGFAIAIGYSAGYTSQGNDAVAVGDYAGGDQQGTNAIAIGLSAGSSNQGWWSTAVGLNADSYAPPPLQMSKHTVVPGFKSTDATPRPNGSVWVKTTSPNSGANFSVKKYTSAGTWEAQSAPLYMDNDAAITAIATNDDPSTIKTGAIYIQYDPSNNDTAGYKIYRWEGQVPLVVVGTATIPALSVNDTFTINGETVTITTATAAGFVSAVSAANITDVSAVVNADGSVSIEHALGGDLTLVDGTGSPLAGCGINTGTNSNWLTLTYEASRAEPTGVPAEDRRWYHNDFACCGNIGSNWHSRY